VNGSGVVVLVWMSELVEMGVTLGAGLVFVALERLPSSRLWQAAQTGLRLPREPGWWVSKAAGRAWDQGSCRDGVLSTAVTVAAVLPVPWDRLAVVEHIPDDIQANLGPHGLQVGSGCNRMWREQAAKHLGTGCSGADSTIGL